MLRFPSSLRRLAPVAAAVSIAWLATCSSIDNIDVDAQGRAVIPQRSIIDELLGNLAFAGFSGFDISQTQEFENAGYTKSQIDSVHLKRFTLTIVNPAGATFDFLSAIRFYAEAADQPRVLIAELDPVPTGQTQLLLDIDATVDLTPYVVAPNMSITTQATGLRPEQETTIDADVVLDVDINVTGSCD